MPVTRSLRNGPPSGLAARVQHCRELAADARSKAQVQSPAQQSYLIVAEQWEELAADLEWSTNTQISAA